MDVHQVHPIRIDNNRFDPYPYPVNGVPKMKRPRSGLLLSSDPLWLLGDEHGRWAGMIRMRSRSFKSLGSGAGTPIAGWFFMDNSIKMGDPGVPLF